RPSICRRCSIRWWNQRRGYAGRIWPRSLVRKVTSTTKLRATAFSPQFKQTMGSYPLEPGRGSITGRVALEGKVVHVHDVQSDSEYKMSERMKLGDVRTVLGVPLLREGIPIGVIILQRRRVQPFTEQQIEVAATFADQAIAGADRGDRLRAGCSGDAKMENAVKSFEPSIDHFIRIIGSGIEIFGVLVIVIGIVWSTYRQLRQPISEQDAAVYKIRIGRSLLLGLEVLVAADIVKTIAHELSVMSLGLLGGLVLVRTFLSWTLVLEIEGRWPWQREPSLMSSRARSG